jgi:hypothetical protein
MKNELPKNLPPALPSATAGKTAAPANPPANGGGKPVPPPAPVAAAPSESVKLFGGHKGGGKKRADGLVAGSPEAIAADKEKNAARMREKRAQEKAAALPPALPSAPAPATNPALPPAGDSGPVPAAPADTFVPAAAVGTVATAPMFVPWSQRVLEKPAKLLTKIIDRFRCMARGKQIKKLCLSAEAEKKVLERLKWREEVTNDFSLALAECATIELNKRRISGSQNAHWINLAMCAGEIVAVEMDNSAAIEKLILEDRAANPPVDIPGNKVPAPQLKEPKK